MASKEIAESPTANQIDHSLNTKELGRKPSLFKPRAEWNINDYVHNYILETVAIIFWLYALSKLFIFDLDVLLLHKFFPDYEWILDFKLILILALVCGVWFWVGTWEALVWFFYVTLYPLVVILIKLPLFVIKQESWVLAVGLLNAVASFFTNLRSRLFFLTIFLSSFAVIIFSDRDVLLIGAAGVMLLLILATYVKSFISSLKPSKIFQIYSMFFERTRTVGHTTFALAEDIRNIPVDTMDAPQLEKWNTSLQMSVLFNRLCLFSAKKLRDYQRSNWQIIPSVFGLLGLIIFTVISFSGVYYGLFKLDNGLFRYSEEPSWFIFFYFSFNNLILNTTAELAPAVPLSQAVYMLQAFLSFLVGIILVTLFISHRAQKASSSLDEVISAVETQGQEMETFIQSEYKVSSIQSAIDQLNEAKASAVKIIYWLSKGI